MKSRLALAVPISLVVHSVLGALLMLIPAPTRSALFVDLTLDSVPAVPGPAEPPPAPAPPPSRSWRHLRPWKSASAPTVPRPAAAPSEIPPAPSAPAAVPPPTTLPPASEIAAAPPAPKPIEDSRPSAAVAETGARSSVVTESPGPAAEGNSRGPSAALAGAESAASAPGGGRGANTVEARATGTGGAGETPGAEYGAYLARLRRQIAESLRYPMVARRRGLTGTVYLEITIHTNGTIGGASVVASSSHPLLDEAALETVKGLAPLPFPAELPPRRLRVRLPVIFRLE